MLISVGKKLFGTPSTIDEAVTKVMHMHNATGGSLPVEVKTRPVKVIAQLAKGVMEDTVVGYCVDVLLDEKSHIDGPKILMPPHPNEGLRMAFETTARAYAISAAERFDRAGAHVTLEGTPYGGLARLIENAGVVAEDGEEEDFEGP